MTDVASAKDGRVATTTARLVQAARAAGMWSSGDGRVGEADAATLIGWTPASLRNARRDGTGPKWYRIGGGGHKISYRLDDLATWLESQAGQK